MDRIVGRYFYMFRCDGPAGNIIDNEPACDIWITANPSEEQPLACLFRGMNFIPWTGDGVIDGRLGRYKWVSCPGNRRGVTDLTLWDDGTFVGHVCETTTPPAGKRRIEWWYRAVLRPEPTPPLASETRLGVAKAIGNNCLASLAHQAGCTVAVATFNTRRTWHCRTDPPALAANRLSAVGQPSGGTHLWDAVCETASAAGRQQLPTLLLVLTDGENVGGSRSLADAAAQLERFNSDASHFAYVVGIGESDPDELRRAVGANGTVVMAENAAALDAIFALATLAVVRQERLTAASAGNVTWVRVQEEVRLRRTPIHVCLVIDTSGSMSGKIA